MHSEIGCLSHKCTNQMRHTAIDSTEQHQSQKRFKEEVVEEEKFLQHNDIYYNYDFSQSNAGTFSS